MVKLYHRFRFLSMMFMLKRAETSDLGRRREVLLAFSAEIHIHSIFFACAVAINEYEPERGLEYRPCPFVGRSCLGEFPLSLAFAV